MKKTSVPTSRKTSDTEKPSRRVTLPETKLSDQRRPSFTKDPTGRKSRPHIQSSREGAPRKSVFQQPKFDDEPEEVPWYKRTFFHNLLMNIGNEDLEPLTQESWKSPWDFIINNVGCVVGNISFLMFPQSCYDYGGVAFMIMYLIVTLLIALPMFYVECLIGTFVCRNPIFIYRNICPIASGVGYAIMYVAILDYVPECIFMTWSIYYFFTSMTPTLPWDTCGNEWNRVSCFTPERDAFCREDNQFSVYYDKKCMTAEEYCGKFNYSFASNFSDETMYCEDSALAINDTERFKSVDQVTTRTSPASDFFLFQVSNMPEDLEWHGLGFLEIGIIFCYTTTWMIIFLAKRGGIKTSVPITHYTATIPLIILVLSSIHGIILEGGIDGLLILKPDFRKFYDLRAWYVATALSLSSQGVASGILTTLASFHNSEATRVKCRIFAIGTNIISNIFFVMVVYSFAGARAKRINVSLHSIFTKRENIIYISYTEVLRFEPVPQLFGIIFFAALSAIGMDVQFTKSDFLVKAICELVPYLGRLEYVIRFLACCFMWLFGFAFVCQGGFFLLTLFVELVPSGLFILTLCEITVLVWLYGYPDSYRSKFFTLRTSGSGGKESVFFKIIVVYCLPIVLPTFLIYSLIDFQPLERYGYRYPIEFEVARVLLFLVPIAIVFGVGSYKCIKALRREESVRDLFKPTPEWISLEKRMQVLQDVKEEND